MLSHAPDNYICPFCLLVRGIENEHVHSVQSDIIYQDADCDGICEFAPVPQ